MKVRKPQLVDREATESAGFLDARSYCKRTRDTGELRYYRFGDDMTLLRIAVFNRAGGEARLSDGTFEETKVSIYRNTAHCEMKVHGVLGARCNRNISWETMELHHEPPKSQGGDDTEEGTMASCRRCQTVRHNRITKFRQPAEGRRA